MFTLPELNYDYDALSGYISAEIMELHHDKHHRTYIEKLNAALEKYPDLQNKTIEELLVGLNSLPDDIRTAVQNNGGGHYNHSLFWQVMSPQGGGRPSAELLEAIEQKYETFDAFVEAFNEKALGLFGSGWVWLQPNLDIVTTADQDSLLSVGEPAPLLGLDVWEHAYYLDYKNHRDDYVHAWWSVVNWAVVEQWYAQSQR